MCDIVLKLLSEKLVDEFYSQDRQPDNSDGSPDGPIEQLKSRIPVSDWDFLYRIESRTVEMGAEELKRFARFVAGMMVSANKA